ncbi:nicotinate-nucleotide adenylyltransferase [Paenibacillus antri]|uniref:Probable nicotinate-nucleotide adenylyltransferase n=1 Tax=Paenibacillus antri TaxID=2582848 RepID=A0A5R9GB66_9BACL|nr:nicotinate-nucleotide adenylyltransferase [Paenibacillus antri]TLS53707.1 nicotinate-nucleotide adenylyltransferase [Paenibacillus antri]
MKRRVGLMGGTFDPVHVGHLVAAERAIEAGGLDEVRFMPTFRPPHKSSRLGGTPEERREMVELAIQDNPRFRLETIELDRGGVSYAVETAAALSAREPDREFVWIVGGDMVLYLPQWHRIEDVAAQVTFLGLTRPGYPVAIEQLPPYLRTRVTLADMPALDVSSTDIRERRERGLSIRYVVTEPVRRYIEERGLYVHADEHR